MLRNNGNGTFSDVTGRSRHRQPRWVERVRPRSSTIDRDGWLDLYVGNYLIYRIEADSTARTSPGSATTARRTATGRSRIACIAIAATARSRT